MLLATAPGEARSHRRHGPVPEIGRLLARNPNARIAIVQGSFDWVHSGHVNLAATVAGAKRSNGKPRYDLVVVAPTYEYSKKPFLKASFGRRLGLWKAAIGEAGLKGRVVVSSATKKLGSRPWDYIESLAKAYPNAKLSYALGGDSYNESVGWPGFDQALKRNRVELIAVPRPGYAIERGRADRVIRGPQGIKGGTKVSSTEIRDALKAGNVEGLKGRVPRTTLAALRQTLQRSAPRPHAAPKADRNAGIAGVQRRMAAERQRASRLRLDINPKGIDPRKGYTDKLMLFGRDGRGRIRGHYLFKQLDRVDAKKEESLTMLANLVGMKTPLAQQHEFRERGRASLRQDGVLLRWTPGLQQAGVKYDFKKASPQVREYLMLSRWFNEVIWNQDVWWGQFLVPKKGSERYKSITNIDFGLAWVKRDPREVQRVLKEHFKIEVPLSQTRWTSRPLKMERKVGWDPKHFDSRYTMYGPLLRDFVMGKVDLDIGRVKAQLQQVKRIPRAQMEQALEPYIRAAKEANWGYVPVQASGKFYKADTFRRKMVDRIYRSVDEYCGFLDQLAQARQNPASQMFQTYAKMTKRDF